MSRVETSPEVPPVPRELLLKYDKPGPRYTSYPTAVEFQESFGPDAYIERLVEADKRAADPLSIYVHIPFCEERCLFCACNVVITRKDEPVRRYLGDVRRELDLVRAQIPRRRRVVQYHWGGGTPTHLDEAAIDELHHLFTERFDFDPDAEIAIEVDPRVTTEGQLRLLRKLGFNRLSMGVQDLDPLVQEAIGRCQTEDETRRTFERGRALGFSSINVDLIYGLPHQTPERFHRTLDGIIDIRPDRLAVYSFAHVPWIKGHQKWLETEALPTPAGKLDLFAIATERLVGAGYRLIGMDHFAVPGDELAVATEERRLFRSFMGYTVRPAPDLLGFGITSIGEVAGAYVQNVKKLSTYHEMLDAGSLPVERGVLMTKDDRLRRDIIQAIMCNLYVDVPAIERHHGINFHETFAAELRTLDEPRAEGFLVLKPDAIEVTPLGRFFIRTIAMVFDRYRRKDPARPVFSRTV